MTQFYRWETVSLEPVRVICAHTSSGIATDVQYVQSAAKLKERIQDKAFTDFYRPK